MDQLKYNRQTANHPTPGAADTPPPLQLPRRTFDTELVVGLFSLVTMLAAGWLAVGLGGANLWSGDYYTIKAEFDNISGLKQGASVEIAGVQVGKVVGLTLQDPEAIVELQISNDVKIHDDDIAHIRTKGIIGDRYVKISRGSSDVVIQPGEAMLETESVVDFEDIIGKIIHSFSSDDSEKDDAETTTNES